MNHTKEINYFEIGKDFELRRTQSLVRKPKKISVGKVLIIDVGFYIIIPLLIAIPLGLYLDSWFKTRNIFTLVLIFIGFISSIYNLFRLTKKV